MPSPKRESVINSNTGFRHNKKTQDIYRGNDRSNITYKANYHANPKKLARREQKRSTKNSSRTIDDEIQFALQAYNFPFLTY